VLTCLPAGRHAEHSMDVGVKYLEIESKKEGRPLSSL